MKIIAKNFSGVLTNGAQFRINWKIQDGSITIMLSIYNQSLAAFCYEDLKTRLFDNDNFLQKLNEVLVEASNDWGIQLIESQELLKKTA